MSAPTLPNPGSHQRSAVVAIIPARMDARRLPGKPLLELGGAPLVWRVYEQVCRCPAVDAVYVASGDSPILDVVEALGGRTLCVSTPCGSGTERVTHAARALDLDHDATVVNVQADEPFVGPDLVLPLVGAIRAGARIATAAAPLDAVDRENRDAVKVVSSADGRALYFSREPIPGDLHVGIYAFRRDALEVITALPRGRAARAEDLEQLSWLEAGHPIDVVRVPRSTLSIDTPDDLARARQLFSLLTIGPPAAPAPPCPRVES